MRKVKITPEIFDKIKEIFDNTTCTVKEIRIETSLGSQTLYRIKNAKNYSDYKAIITRDRQTKKKSKLFWMFWK